MLPFSSFFASLSSTLCLEPTTYPSHTLVSSSVTWLCWWCLPRDIYLRRRLILTLCLEPDCHRVHTPERPAPYLWLPPVFTWLLPLCPGIRHIPSRIQSAWVQILPLVMLVLWPRASCPYLSVPHLSCLDNGVITASTSGGRCKDYTSLHL